MNSRMIQFFEFYIQFYMAEWSAEFGLIYTPPGPKLCYLIVKMFNAYSAIAEITVVKL